MKQEQAVLSVPAYKKLVFHCLRYPSSKVYGALIRDTTTKQMSDCYPLFHTSIVAPTLSLALDLVQSNIAANEEICGFYQFCEQANGSSNQSSVAIQRIVQSCPQFKGMIVVRVGCKNKSFTFSSEQISLKTPSSDVLNQDLLDVKFRGIIDFDAHLDAIELDFRNKWVQ